MQVTAGRGAVHNPFCSERVRPGSIGYLLPPNRSIECLVQDLEKTGFIGQIVGPHGAGKSTLLYSLAAELTRRGYHPKLEEAGRCERSSAAEGEIILLDSAERESRRHLRNRARGISRAGGGLVLTTHSDLGLPTLLQASVSPGTAHLIVCALLEGWEVEPPTETVVAELLSRHEGNMRFALFELYDWFEHQVAGHATS